MILKYDSKTTNKHLKKLIDAIIVNFIRFVSVIQDTIT